MKLLYVYQQPRSSTSGLSIYDKRLSGALENLGHEVHRLPLHESAPKSGFAGIFRAIPPAIARFQTSFNAESVADAIVAVSPDRVILSHESMLFLIEQGLVRKDAAVVLCHNMMAAGYASRRSIPDRIYAILFDRYERRLARCGIPVTAISQYDRRTARRRYGLELAADCPPGVLPGTTAVDTTAQFARTLTIAGNYDWRLKRQDIQVFFAEVLKGGLDRNFTLHLSQGAARYAPHNLHFRLGVPDHGKIGVGVVVDRFQAGFKLKALEYVSAGMIIASYSDLFEEFAEAPHSDIFVRHIKKAAELPRLFAELEEIPNLGLRYREFQQYVITKYQWNESARALHKLL